MKELVKDFWSIILGIAFMIGILLLALLFIKGGLWLSTTLYPWLMLVSIMTFVLSLLILLPLGIFKKTRFASGIGFFIASYVFALTAWVWSFLLAYILWGFFGLSIGLFIGGIGVVPIAMLATLFSGEWFTFLGLTVLVIAISGSNVLSVYFIEKSK